MNKNIQYLVEDDFLSERRIDEIVDRGQKLVLLQGTFGHVNTINKNKRRYKEEIVRPQIEKLQESVFKTGQFLFGRLEHPLKEEELIPDFKDACIGIFELELKGNNIDGKAIVLETEKGMELRNIIKAYKDMNKEPKIGTSTRGTGSLVQVNEGNESFYEVQKDFTLFTIDAVSKPSASTYAGIGNNLTESIGNAWLMKQGLLVLDENNADKTAIIEKVNEEALNPSKITLANALRTATLKNFKN